MASNGKSSSDSDVSAQRGTWKLQLRRSTAPCEFPAQKAPRSGTGFETLPSLAILSNLLRFLKFLDLKLVDLWLENVPFHFGWDIVVWNPKLSVKPVDLGVNLVEIVEIYDEVEEEQPEIFGPHIELNPENPSDLGEPPVEAVGEAPTVVEIERLLRR